jgi:hypothetical protein
MLMLRETGPSPNPLSALQIYGGYLNRTFTVVLRETGLSPNPLSALQIYGGT